MTDIPLLADGAYDVFVVDATVGEVDGARTVELDLTITTGEHKGEVVTLRADGLRGEEFDLIGMPGTLTVTDGHPHVAIDG